MSYSLPISPSQADTETELRKRIPRVQTQGSAVDSISTFTSHTDQIKSPVSPSASHQRFVLTDHVAFRYLEEDPSATVLSRREKLEGYEIYLVEQWACSRIHPTFVITTYTGDPKDVVWASVLSVPKDESEWSPQMRVYFRSLNEYHARRKETSLGTLMLTNLNGFPSSLTIIPIPEGNMKKNRELFFVNEDLKRLGCSGRLGIKLAPPNSATQAKFHQLYRTSDKIPLNSSVIELVKLCQVALVIFDKLEPEYADGLLCDITEKAINDWWVEFGQEYYTIEPHDGILGPTTVAALLGMLMGARNRLSAYNAPVAKDVFDVESTKRAISYFQKTQRIQKTRRLDRQTLERLRKATAKAASRESWAVPRAFKTAVGELGGKGGEMVMGMVGAGEKAGIAEIETVDIERFIELVSGERAKWLWYGKPRKSNTGDMFNRLPSDDKLASPDDRQPDHIVGLLKRESTLESHGISKQDTMDLAKHTDSFGTVDGIDKERDPNSKRAAIKRATGKIESGSGFHRIKDVVGRRNHQPKPSKDETLRSPLQHARADTWTSQTSGADVSLATKLQETFRQSSDPRSEADSSQLSAKDEDPTFTRVLTETPQDSASVLAVDQDTRVPLDGHSDPTSLLGQSPEDLDSSKPPTVDNSVAGSMYRHIDKDSKLPTAEAHETPPLLRRTQSNDQLDPYHQRARHEDWWPRHLSFSIAEESVLRWESVVTTSTQENREEAPLSITTHHATQKLLSEEYKRLRHKLFLLSSLDRKWVDANITTIADLENDADADIQQLDSLYYPALDSYQSLREDAHEIISSSRTHLTESMRDLTNLSDKLEYEIGTLRSKVDDVEDGAAELQRQVEFVEARVVELESVLGGQDREGWLRWALRIMTGIGQPPA